MDGRPGSRYWQNHGRYVISVTAMPPRRTVTGTEQISYQNNSPDTLRDLVFKLFLNIHKPGAPRNGGASEAYLTSGVQIDTFAVNGRPGSWGDDAGTFTLRRIPLPSPLAPRDSIHVSFAWHYDVSPEHGREGMIDSTTLFLAYFYPRIAVYDDYNGWDVMAFTDMQEFYSDFNDYDVSVRVPTNFVVWGTGTLTNPEAVLQPEYARRLQASFSSDQTIHIATREEMAAHSVTRQDSVNTWRFTATDIPDVAFGLSDHYDWDGASVVVDDATGRRASAQAAFNDTAADYHHMVQFSRHALGWLSHQWPGVPYPYEKSTVFEGKASMEYPMMVNDRSYMDTLSVRRLVEHETSHAYFPFYMGTNETRYAFMDEGWATALEYLMEQVDVGPERAAGLFKRYRVSSWIEDPSPLADLPIVTPADVLKDQAYGDNAYGKPALAYLAVKDLLGDAVFGRSLREFMVRWHGKHPTPWDFFNTMNDVSGRNLNWFWSAWFFSTDYIDFAVTGVTRTAGGYSVRVRNIGGMPAPFDLAVLYRDGTTSMVHTTPAVWAQNHDVATVALATRKPVQSVEVNGGIWMDADPTNNQWTVK